MAYDFPFEVQQAAMTPAIKDSVLDVFIQVQHGKNGFSVIFKDKG